MLAHKHNSGCGELFCFHGAYNEKSKALAKEATTPGAFIKMLPYSSGFRYAVMTRRKEAAGNPRKNAVDAAVKLSNQQLAIRNKAFDWMVEHDGEYASAQMLAQAASTKYSFPVSGLINAARQLIPPGKKNPEDAGWFVTSDGHYYAGPFRSKIQAQKIAKTLRTKDHYSMPGAWQYRPKVEYLTKKNPLFTRGERRKLRKRLRHSVKGAARRGIFRLFGVGGGSSRSSSSRSGGKSTPGKSSGTRDDVISALTNQGFSRTEAARMTPQPSAGEDFTSLFRRAIRRNPSLTESERRALTAFRDFHGKDPDKVIRMENTVIESGNYFLVGEFFGYDLTAFPIERFSQVKPNVFAEGAGIKLCAGKIEEQDRSKMVAHQLFLMGGNQDLEFALKDKFGITSGAQLLDLGEIKNIWYKARKKQDSFQLYHYHHTFGEEGGSRPYLMYDRVHKKQFIIGGDYSVPLEGIRN